MSPEIESGVALIFDRREPCRPGDIVLLWLRPECVPPGSHQRLIKRLISVTSSGPQPRVRLEMNNPHRQWDIPRNRLLGIHRCMGPVPPHRQRVKVTDEQVRALGRESN